MKVVTILGTRPEIIRLSRVMAALDKAADHTVVHTGQNYDYELNQIFYEDFDLRPPDEYLDAAGATAAETIAQVIAKTDALLREVKPDAVLLLGDTNSCMAAIAAKKLRIPIFHMEAGNRCFDQRVPEEINRRMVDHIADINLPYSSIAREYLLREGLPPDRVIKTGSPMYEVLSYQKPKIESSTVVQDLGLKSGQYFVLSVHRAETVDERKQLENLHEVLQRLSDEFRLPVIVSTHPRTRKQLDAFGRSFSPLVKFHRPFSFTDYVRLQLNAKATLSDSGTITEESSILGFPALNLREAHERPEGMEEAAVMMTGLEWKTIYSALKILEQHSAEDDGHVCLVNDYNVRNVSKKVVKIIQSYTAYVEKRVYRIGL